MEPMESEYRPHRARWLKNYFQQAPPTARVPVAEIRNLLKCKGTSNNAELGLIVRQAFPSAQRKKCGKTYYYYGLQSQPYTEEVIPNSCSDHSGDLALEDMFLSKLPSSDLIVEGISEVYNPPNTNSTEAHKCSKTVCVCANSYKGEKVLVSVQDKELTKEIENHVSFFGGFIEQMLSHQVTLVITNVEEPESKSKLENKQLTRGRQLLGLVKGNTTKYKSFAEKCKSLGCKVESAKSNLEKIRCHRNNCNDTESIKAAEGCSVVHLKSPFLKFQDVKQQYKPVYKQFASFPRLTYDGNETGAPFCKAKLRPKKALGLKGQMKTSYCEYCEEWYKNVKEHCASSAHCSMVEATDFSTLDETIGKSSLQMYLDKLKQV